NTAVFRGSNHCPCVQDSVNSLNASSKDAEGYQPTWLFPSLPRCFRQPIFRSTWMYNSIGTECAGRFVTRPSRMKAADLHPHPDRGESIMHTIAYVRVLQGLSSRALAFASLPLRLLIAQPASPMLPILFYLPIAVAAVLWNLLAGPVAGWTFIVLPL